MKKLVFVILFIFSVSAIFSQNKITFIVTDTLSHPLIGVAIALDSLPIAKTDSMGKAVFANVPTGYHKYSTNKAGFVGFAGSFTETGNQTISVILKVVPAPPPVKYSVAFAIKDSLGNKLTGANIYFNTVSYPTDSLGKVTIRDIPRGVYNFVAYKTGFVNFSGSFTIDSTNKSVSVILKSVPPTQ